jgi:transposase-like protein
MSAHTRGKKEPFARRLGINSRSVTRWLDQEVDVSEESVRLVARTFDVTPVQLLVRVGYYHHGELRQPHLQDADEADPALKVIEDSDEPDHVKERLRERLYELRRRRSEAEVDEVKWWLNQVGEG